MREIELAMTLIEQGDTYLLQLRNTEPEKGAAGLVGCFGGRIEAKETAYEAALRELSEETSLTSDNALEELGNVKVVSDRDNEPVHVKASVFRLVLDPLIQVEAHDGELVILHHTDVGNSLDKMTPATRKAFEELILKEK